MFEILKDIFNYEKTLNLNKLKWSEIKVYNFAVIVFLAIDQRPLYARTGFQYIIPPFLMCLPTKGIFLHYRYKLFNFDIIQK